MWKARIYGHYKYFTLSMRWSTLDVRIWRLKSITALKGLFNKVEMWPSIKAELGRCLVLAGARSTYRALGTCTSTAAISSHVMWPYHVTVTWRFHGNGCLADMPDPVHFRGNHSINNNSLKRLVFFRVRQSASNVLFSLKCSTSQSFIAGCLNSRQ